MWDSFQSLDNEVDLFYSLNCYNACQSASTSDEHLDQPLVEHRSYWKNCQLPKRYWNILPDTLVALPPVLQLVTSKCALTMPLATIPESYSFEQTSKIDSFELLKSTWNKFDLFHQYHATRFPNHDPNENITYDNLMDMSLDTFSGYPADSYHLYLTQSLFLLEEWYWNGGLKKMHSGFQDLVEIVRHPSF